VLKLLNGDTVCINSTAVKCDGQKTKKNQKSNFLALVAREVLALPYRHTEEGGTYYFYTRYLLCFCGLTHYPCTKVVKYGRFLEKITPLS